MVFKEDKHVHEKKIQPSNSYIFLINKHGQLLSIVAKVFQNIQTNIEQLKNKDHGSSAL